MLVLDGHKSAVYALAFSPDGDRLASGDREGTVLLWAGGDPDKLAMASPATATGVNSLAFTRQGRQLVIAWSNAGGDASMSDEAEARNGIKLVHIIGTAVAAVGTDYFVWGGGDRNKPAGSTIKLISDSKSGRLPEFSAPKGVRTVSTAGERVAWSEWGRLAYVWDIRKPDRVKIPLASEAPCVVLAPDGASLVVGLDNYTVTLFDVASRQERRSFVGHTGRVTVVAFTPDGSTVVSGSWDGTVRLWDVGSGGLRASYCWPVGKVTAVAVSPDGLRLAIGGSTGAIVLADLD